MVNYSAVHSNIGW